MNYSSNFYCDLEYPAGSEPAWLTALNEYSESSQKRVYVMREPVTDTDNTEYDSNFVMMITGAKICVIRQSDEKKFEAYKEDVIESISYLYRKYNYRNELGLFSELRDKLITNAEENQLSDIDKFLKDIEIEDPLDIRRSELLISLCIGNPNEIDRVGDLVPTTILDKVKHKILLFDGDQTRFIYEKKNKHVVRIQGLSGSGKTELLLHKVKELYLADEKNTIFFTCHNRILAAKLHDRIEKFFNDQKVNRQIAWEKRLWCTNAWGRSVNSNSGLYRYICSCYDITFQGYSQGLSFNTLCKIALEKLNSMEDFAPILDYVIVDESQDFDESFFDLCEKVTRRQVYLAGDVFQSIFAEHIEKAYDADYLLSKCYRTAPDTLLFAHALGLGLFEKQKYRWLSENDWKTCGYNVTISNNEMTLSREPSKRFDDDELNYESIEFLRSDSASLSVNLCNLIKKLKEESHNQLMPEDVAIIFIDDDRKIYSWANNLEMVVSTELGWEVNKAYETKEVQEGKVFISNRSNSKGLEFPYVFCITERILDDHHYRNSIYTMLTRSFIKSFLMICGDNATIPAPILSGWDQIKREHQMTIKIPSKEEQKEIELRFTEAKKSMSLRERVDIYAKMHAISDDMKNRMLQMLQILNVENLDEDQINEKIAQVEALCK